MKPITIALLAATALAVSSPAFAQQTETTTTVEREEQREFPWGLLGLLGLAGLIPRKRETHVHPTTTTTTNHDTTRR